jgi:hypothetical protein
MDKGGKGKKNPKLLDELKELNDKIQNESCCKLDKFKQNSKKN